MTRNAFLFGAIIFLLAFIFLLFLLFLFAGRHCDESPCWSLIQISNIAAASIIALFISYCTSIWASDRFEKAKEYRKQNEYSKQYENRLSSENENAFDWIHYEITDGKITGPVIGGAMSLKYEKDKTFKIKWTAIEKDRDQKEIKIMESGRLYWEDRYHGYFWYFQETIKYQFGRRDVFYREGIRLEGNDRLYQGLFVMPQYRLYIDRILKTLPRWELEFPPHVFLRELKTNR